MHLPGCPTPTSSSPRISSSSIHTFGRGEILIRGRIVRVMRVYQRNTSPLAPSSHPCSPIFAFWRISPRQLAISRPLVLSPMALPFTWPTSWCFTNSTSGEQSSSTTSISITFVVLRCETARARTDAELMNRHLFGHFKVASEGDSGSSASTSKTRAEQVCFAFNKGECTTSPCPGGCVHKCRKCSAMGHGEKDCKKT
jgi:hypothetical protein